MKESVRLAKRAKDAFVSECSQAQIESGGGESRVAVAIALSLGPFGASVSPTQEFDGFYPPPYGPREYTHGGENINDFGCNFASLDHSGLEGGALKDELASIEALAQFHYERLEVFAEDREVWDTIDCIAFETVPLVREAMGIRLAMKRLEERLRSSNGRDDSGCASKPWWISFVCPEGRLPERKRGSKEERKGMDDVVRAVWDAAVLQPYGVVLEKDSTGSLSETLSLPVPHGIGINCTSLEFIPGLVRDLQANMRRYVADLPSKPWLILYPNGGDVYDPITRSWKVVESGADGAAVAWADKLRSVVNATVVGDPDADLDIWGGVIVGGCCRTGTGHIRALASDAVADGLAL
ncbi:hypothetical protein AX16_008251 [Volvariella volvacea WC 439]|nr:hypothetical protein AX16_008251 [Volvariella volvacea WC 439]